MTIRHTFLQRSMDRPTKIIAFPHSTSQAPYVYSLALEEQDILASGTMDPLTDKYLQTLEHLGIERVRVVGDSVGSTIGAQFIERAAETSDIAVGHSVLFEPVNVLPRTTAELKDNVKRGGLKPFLNAVNESGIPVYSQVQHTRGILDYPALLHMFLNFSLNAARPESKALIKGLRGDVFPWEATVAMMSYTDMQLVIAGGETSLMFPRPVAVVLRNQLRSGFPGRMSMYTAKGRGHEVANHLPTFVLVAKAALEGQGLTLPSTV
jgi:pimeloyl-ACP methyl ester carboxylesterase